MTAGTNLAAWPSLLVGLSGVLAILAASSRRSGPAALITMGVYVAIAGAGTVVDLPGSWLFTEPRWMLAMAAGGSLIMMPRHAYDAFRPASPPGSRE